MKQLFLNIISWIKSNKLTSFLVLVIAYIFFTSGRLNPIIYNTRSRSFGSTADFAFDNAKVEKSVGFAPSTAPSPRSNTAPQIDVNNRMVVTNSQMSILTKNIRDSIDAIQKQTETIGGYLVTKNINTPRSEGTESGNITVRIPITSREDFVVFLRTVGVKVVNERITADDVTDEYVDIQGRLDSLNKVKSRYEEIMAATENVDQILKIQQNINNVQNQIDSLLGQLNYLNTTSRSSLITINLSTDELALPFTPENPWRPNIIVKLAVRSLLTNAQKLGTALIWVGVYAIVWIPALVLYKWLKKRFKKQTV